MQSATTSSGETTGLDDADVKAFADRLDGDLLRPGDEGYDKARRLWNGVVDKRPALIVVAADEADVAKAVRYAKDRRLLLSVRGGGHNVSGNAMNDGGLVIDLGRLDDVDVDPEARRVRCGGGATIGDLDEATQRHGLAVPQGVVSKTGVAGLTLSGGIGWMRCKHGLSCDNLLAARVVTANGSVVVADEQERPELLWGLRGGGGNFGIVTEFLFRAHPIGPEVRLAFVFHDGERIAEALRYYRDWCKDAPREASSFAICGNIPPKEDFPEKIHGKRFILFAAMYNGSPEEGEAVLRPLVDFGTPLLDMSGVVPYLEAQTLFDDDYPDGMRYYWKSLYLDSLDDKVVDAIAHHDDERPGPLSTIDVWQMGGAIGDMDASKSAFGGREAPFLLGVEANWEDAQDDDENMAWARATVKDMQRFSTGGEYLNFPGFQEGGQETLRKTFGNKYARLAALKKAYDPENLFRMNHNIEPTS